jgi:hypothetical protein
MMQPFAHGLLRVGVEIAAIVCFWLGFVWIRDTYRMNRSGEARRLVLPFPALLWQDIVQQMLTAITRRNGMRSPWAEGLERVRFKSIIVNNYLKAVMILIFGLIAASMVYKDFAG